jgi:hypothetical protein
MIRLYVPAFLVLLGLRHPVAQNVSQAQNAVKMKPASTKNVEIHALELVVWEQNAVLSITTRFAAAHLDILAIHLQDAIQNVGF